MANSREQYLNVLAQKRADCQHETLAEATEAVTKWKLENEDKFEMLYDHWYKTLPM